MKNLFISILFLVTVIDVKSQVFSSNKVNVHFFFPNKISTIDAHTKNATVIVNAKKREIKALIPINSFNFKNTLMQQHFNDIYLESKKFPYAIFKCKFKGDINLKENGVYLTTLSGKLSLHGASKTINIPCELSINNEEISFNTDFKLALNEYKIKTPSLLNKEINQDININVNGVLIKEE